jgi:hypothetical protein
MAHTLKPKKIRRLYCSDATASMSAWWYENDRSIDIFMRNATRGETMQGRIPRAQIVAWIKRTEKK